MISIQAALNEQLIRVIPINHSGTTPVVVMIDGRLLRNKIYILVQRLTTGDLGKWDHSGAKTTLPGLV